MSVSAVRNIKDGMHDLIQSGMNDDDDDDDHDHYWMQKEQFQPSYQTLGLMANKQFLKKKAYPF